MRFLKRHTWIVYAIFGMSGVLLLGLFGFVYIKFYLGLNVTSWWRSIWHNAAIGGKIYSPHLIGLGYDVTPPSNANFAALHALFPHVIFENGSVVVDTPAEADHIHAGWIKGIA